MIMTSENEYLLYSILLL